MRDARENINCPYCRHYSGSFFAQIEEFKYVKCMNCESILLWPTPSPGDVEKANRKSYGGPAPSHPDNSGYKRASFEHRQEHYLKDLFLTFDEIGLPIGARGQKVLDVGCADGHLLDIFREHGWETFGTDIVNEYTRHTNPVHKVFVGDISKDDFRKKLPMDFDLVCLSDVVEHTRSPRQLIQGCSNVLREGGLLFLQGPCTGLVAESYGKDWRQLIPPYHINIPSYLGLELALRFSRLYIQKFVRWGCGAGDTGQVPDRHRNAWNRIVKKAVIGDTIGLLARKG